MSSITRVLGLCLCLVLTAGLAQTVEAQPWKKLKDKVEEKGKQAAGKVAGRAADAAVDTATDKAADKAAAEASEAVDKALSGSESGETTNVSASGNAGASGAAGLGALGALMGAQGGGSVETIDFRELKALLPESVPGMKRTNATGEKSSALGISTSNAVATFESEDGERSLEVKITDMGSMRGFAMMGYAWAGTEIDSETETGYERTITYKGFPGYEQFDHGDGYSNAQLSIVVGQRFLVEANGSNVDMDAVKAAVDQVDVAKLDAMKEVGLGEGMEIVDFQTLKALLPSGFAGFERTSATGQKSTALGITSSYAEGQYASGDANVKVTITDLGSLKGLTALGFGWLVTEVETESDTGYERTGKYKGYPSHEKFEKNGDYTHAQLDVVVHQRFMVSAEGTGATMEQVKAAVDAIDLSQFPAPEAGN